MPFLSGGTSLFWVTPAFYKGSAPKISSSWGLYFRSVQPETFSFKLKVTSFLCQNCKQMKLLEFFFPLHIVSITSVLVISFCAFFKLSLYLQDSTFWVLNPLYIFKFLPPFLSPSLFKPKLNIPSFLWPIWGKTKLTCSWILSLHSYFFPLWSVLRKWF